MDRCEEQRPTKLAERSVRSYPSENTKRGFGDAVPAYTKFFARLGCHPAARTALPQSNIAASKETLGIGPMLEPQLLAFIRTSIPSIWALELLLLLRRAAPGYLTRDELVQHLRATPTLIDRLLAQFLASRLIAQNGSNAYRFDCATPAMAALCQELAVAAEERPIALRDAIISAPNDKLRDLADAFRLKDSGKGSKGGPDT